jgi:hypothetical protein
MKGYSSTRGWTKNTTGWTFIPFIDGLARIVKKKTK